MLFVLRAKIPRRLSLPVLVGDLPPILPVYHAEVDTLTQLISPGRGVSSLFTHQICSPFAKKCQNTHTHPPLYLPHQLARGYVNQSPSSSSALLGQWLGDGEVLKV